MKKQVYEKPEMSVEVFETEDIIMNSNETEPDPTNLSLMK
ncbi:hypothetical protein SAMN04488579_1184 [Eubacterium barkeri]|uniref:Uncharacterized protein n=1 Tax=Eubacterium barkeri TaxID=1528 RepID=A0A1H3HJX4_EUBBA|nr:hypothetical protein SAMN04488579_1184 [Eubacterium barkeri]